MSVTDLPDQLSPAARAFVSQTRELVIDGEHTPAADGRTFDTFDPATARPITSVAQAGAEDVDQAIVAARRALEGKWGKAPAAQRARALNRLADLVEEHGEELAQLESLDNGK